MLYPQDNENRTAQKLDGFWDFQPQREGDNASGWETSLPSPLTLAVPGSWNEQHAELFKFFGKGYYQRKVIIPADFSGKKIWLRVGAAHYKTRAWLNGEQLGDYEGGSLPSEYDATDAARPGEENILTICVDATLDPWGLPPATLFENEERIGFHNCNPPVTYDFFPYSGIHRSVWFYATPQNRIEDIFIVSEVKGTMADVRCTVRPTSVDDVKKIEITIEDQSFHLQRSGEVFTGTLQIDEPRIWDIGKPELYEATVRMESSDGSTDTYNQTFGIRTVEVNEKGIVLNGRNVFLKGFGKHEDSDAFGRGFNAPMAVRDFDIMKWIGANSFRTSHYPYAEEMYDLADRMGILVIGETPFVGMNDRMFTPEVKAKALPMIERMIARDKNHPSVIAWSLANEPYVSTDRAEAFFKDMAETARKADPTRPITYVAHVEVEDNRGIPYYDFICLNKYYGWYIGHGEIDKTLDAFEKCLDEYYAAFKKPLILTEFGADAVPGMHSYPAQPFSEEFQSEMVEKQYKRMLEKDYVCGAHVWNFADFKTSQTLSRIIHNRKGVFSRDRQPKLVAHTLRRLWNKEAK